MDFQVKAVRGTVGQVDCMQRALFSHLKYHPDSADILGEGYEASDIFGLIETFHKLVLEQEEEEDFEFAGDMKDFDSKEANIDEFL